MSVLLQNIPILVLAALAFSVLGALLAALIAFALASRIARFEPRVRHRALVLIAVLPVLTASTLMLSALLPAVLSFVVPSLDHCTAHDDVHAHLCLVHSSQASLNLPCVLFMAFVLTYAAVHGLLSLMRVGRALRVVRALAATGERREDLGVIVVEAHAPICVAAGLMRPEILVSRGLIEALGDEERAVVLAHERAHVRRRDALVAAIVRVLRTLHFPFVDRWLAAELSIAAEEICDDEAAGVVGDRLAVASAILRVERLALAPATGLAQVAVGFGTLGLDRRIASLLGPSRTSGTLRVPIACFVVGLLSAVATSPEIHHATESVLSLVAY